MFFLMIVLALWVRKKRRAMALMIAALLLMHRAGAVLFALLVALRSLWSFVSALRGTRKKNDELGIVWPTCITAALLALPVYWPLLHVQFVGLRKRVLRTSTDIPNYADTYQTAGTFLTTTELLQVNRWILLLG